MAVPNIFGSATAAIPLSQLDQNFATAITLGNTAVYLGNTTTSLGNVTLTNVTISSGNVSVSTATVGAGSNTAPSITTTGDTNTGIFFPAADTIAFSEGGVESMRIDSSGNVGIGTSSPSSFASAGLPLVVGSGSGNTGMTIYSGTAASGSINFADGTTTTDSYRGIVAYSHTSNYMTLWTDATERMRINSSGNVGIGGGTNNAYNFVITNNNTTTGANQYSIGATSTLSGTSFSSSFLSQLSIPTGITADKAAGYRIVNPTLVGTGAITNNYGIYIDDLTSGTNDYGIASLVSSGTNKWNIYASGTADNYFAGNVLVGTTTTLARFSLRSSGNDTTTWTAQFEASDGTDQFGVRSDGATYMGLDGASPYNLITASAANAALLSDGFFYRSTSSLKYKRNVTNATHGLVEVMQLRPVTYKGKSEADGDKVFGGLIAEEVHEAGLIEFVQYAEDGSPDALAYGNMVSLCIKAIQEQQAIITALQADVAALKGTP